MRVSILAVVVAAVPFVAQASDLPSKKAETAPAPVVKANGSLYVFGMGGAALPNTIEATQNVDPLGELNVQVGLDTGYAFSGGVGYKFDNGLRIEGELGYLNVGTSSVNLPDISDYSEASGKLDGVYGMANAWYAVELGSIRPFIGGGLGYASLNMKSSYYVSDPSNGINDGAGAFAWQVGGGVEFDIAKNTSLVARYRYFATSDFTVKDNDNTDVKGSFNTNIVDVGLRYSF